MFETKTQVHYSALFFVEVFEKGGDFDACLIFHTVLQWGLFLCIGYALHQRDAIFVSCLIERKDGFTKFEHLLNDLDFDVHNL